MKKLILIMSILISSLFSQDLSGIKICLDPGHSGHESDDRGMPTGFWESESNLTKAERLKEMLTDIGAEVILTRKGNGNDFPDDLSLSERAGIANSNHVDFMNSIHSNGWNGERNYTLVLFRGYDNNPVFDNAKTMANILALNIYRANRTTGYSIRGDWDFYDWGTSGLGVLRPLTMPGTLTEGSFHDYYPESYRLLNLDYRKKEAWALAQSFIEYFNKTPYGIGHIAGLVRDDYETVSYYSLNTSDNYKPINNITATLTPGNIIYTGDNNNNGFFFFDSLALGTYQVKIEATGYHTDSATVVVGSNFFNFKDFKLSSSIPPTLLSSIPANGDSCVPAWDPIELTFNKPIDTSSVSSAITISPSIPLIFTYENDNKKINITSDSLKFVYSYTLTISDSLKDRWGYSFDADGDGVSGDSIVINFTTGKEDMTAPSISSIYPGVSSSGIQLHPIFKYIFDEELNDTSVTSDKFYLEKYSNHSSVPLDVVHNVVNGKSIIHLFPKEKLQHDEIYKRIIYKGLEDLFGNPMPSNLQFTFMTGSNKYEITEIDDFESGLTSNWWSPSSSGSTTGILVNSAIRENGNYLNLLTESQRSMELEYGFDTTKSEWLLREYLAGRTPRSINFNDSYILQVYIFGDGSGNKFRFCVDDDGGTEVSPWYEITWIGWQLISWNFSSTGTWPTVSDGNLDGNLIFDSIHLTYNDNGTSPNIGTIYFDDLRVVKSVPADINDEPTIPNNYTLYQNYPNPFNPVTTIKYNILKNTNVKINIFDLAGKKVTTLINENQNSGIHSIQFDGNNFASGIYYYQLLTPEYSEVKKMVLIK